MKFKITLASALVAIPVLVFASAALAHIGGLTVDDKGELSTNRTVATISGQVQCTAGETLSVSVSVIQTRGGGLTSGFGSTSMLCDGSVQDWSVLVTAGIGGSYQPGPATVGVTAFTFGDGNDDHEVDSQFVTTKVGLHK